MIGLHMNCHLWMWKGSYCECFLKLNERQLKNKMQALLNACVPQNRAHAVTQGEKVIFLLTLLPLPLLASIRFPFSFH